MTCRLPATGNLPKRFTREVTFRVFLTLPYRWEALTEGTPRCLLAFLVRVHEVVQVFAEVTCLDRVREHCDLDTCPLMQDCLPVDCVGAFHVLSSSKTGVLVIVVALPIAVSTFSFIS